MTPRGRITLALAVALASCGEAPTARGGDGRLPGDGGAAVYSDQASGSFDGASGSDGAAARPPEAGAPGGGEGVPPPADGSAPQPDAKLEPDQGVAPPPAAELLLVDAKNQQFTTGDNGFHPLIKPGDPLPASDWLKPDDYYDGEMQMRYVIQGPPDQQAGKLQTCIWTMGNEDGDGKNYFPESCSAQVAHTGVGTTFNTKLAPSSWWMNGGVPLDFSHPERFLIRVVLRGTSGCNVTTYNVSNGCWDEWPKYQDMKFRVTIVMVPKGATFSGWSKYP